MAQFKLAVPIDVTAISDARGSVKVAVIQLSIWPWVIFRVTQDCGLGKGAQVIVDEGFSNTRWNVPTILNVTLTANDKACCIRKPLPCKEAECFVLTHACDVETNHMGGNIGAPAAPQGYVNPGAAFAEAISISGTTECTGVDYYELEYEPVAGSYSPMPASSLGGFTRSFLDFKTSPFTWNSPGFTPQPKDGHTVYETPQHYEANNPPSSGTWGSSRIWVANLDEAAVWVRSAAAWADGTYKLRIRGYKETGGHLAEVPLNSCDGGAKGEIVLTLDNRPVLPDPFLPGDHPCGGDTVYTCTTQPDTNIVAVRLKRANESVDHVVPCYRYQRAAGDSMEIDFYAYDPDGHLGFLTFIATYGLNRSSDLLVGITHSPFGGIPGIPPAEQAVADYNLAVAGGAAAPTWAGGAMTLELTAAQVAAAFPEPCCYQLELRAYKRTIVGCKGDFPYNNLTEYSFLVG